MRYLVYAGLLIIAAATLLTIIPPRGDAGGAWLAIVTYPTMAGVAGLLVLAGAGSRLKGKWIAVFGWFGGFYLGFQLANALIYQDSHFLEYGEQQFLHTWFVILFPSACAVVVYKTARLMRRAGERGRVFSPRNVLAGVVVLLPFLLVAYKDVVVFQREKQVEAGAAAGDEDAKCKLAQWQYEHADDLMLNQGDLPGALELYRRSGDYGIADAQWQAALMYMKGIGTAPDRREAKKWLLRAAQAGYGQAQHDLAQQDLDDGGDDADALFWAILAGTFEDRQVRDIWSRLSKGQAAAAMDRLAAYQPARPGKGLWCPDPVPPAPNPPAGRLRMQSYLYRYGLGVPQDETQWLLLQAQAARLGDQISRYNIGSMSDAEVRAVGEGKKQERLAKEHAGTAAPH